MMGREQSRWLSRPSAWIAPLFVVVQYGLLALLWPVPDDVRWTLAALAPVGALGAALAERWIRRSRVVAGIALGLGAGLVPTALLIARAWGRAPDVWMPISTI